MTFDSIGPRFDRRWMIVNEDSVFVSQRSHPRLNVVDVEIVGETLLVSAPGMPKLSVDTSIDGVARTKTVSVWDDPVDAALCAPECGQWFSELLQEPVELVSFSGGAHRLADQRFAPPDALVSSSDGFPVLVCTLASLADLNGRLKAPVPMSRFRPNIVLRGGRAYEEDDWLGLSVGQMVFTARSPCARCSVITVREGSAERTKEPLRTLSEYRKTEAGVIFGQNLTHSGAGTIRVGDPVSVGKG